MIGKIAVSAANFAIDKPYSYFYPEEMGVLPGMRVIVPFGRSNRHTEGVVLSVEQGSPEGLKSIERPLDETPLLSGTMLRLAAFMRERYFCTFYDAVRVMLPAGLWFQSQDTYALTEDRSWQEKNLRQCNAQCLLQLLLDCGGQTDGKVLRSALPCEEDFEQAVAYLLKKKWITAHRDFLRRTGDKQEHAPRREKGERPQKHFDKQEKADKPPRENKPQQQEHKPARDQAAVSDEEDMLQLVSESSAEDLL